MILTVVVMFLTLPLLAPNTYFTLSVERMPVNMPLVYAIANVESSFDITANNDYEMAKGILQIRECVIIDVNRIFGLNYNHDDVYNPFKAIQIFTLYMKAYGAKTVRDSIMLWNMGPKAIAYPYYTNSYYNKVMKKYRHYLTVVPNRTTTINYHSSLKTEQL